MNSENDYLIPANDLKLFRPAVSENSSMDVLLCLLVQLSGAHYFLIIRLLEACPCSKVLHRVPPTPSQALFP